MHISVIYENHENNLKFSYTPRQKSNKLSKHKHKQCAYLSNMSYLLFLEMDF